MWPFPTKDAPPIPWTDKQRCDCGSEFSDVFGQIDDYCHYHDRTQPIYSRYIRFAQYVIGKATQGEKTP